MNKFHSNPISVKSLWENSWVFTLYGLFCGLVAGGMEYLELGVAEIETLMKEPLSIYAFGFISIFGLLGLGVISITTSKSSEKMHSSRWVSGFWVPISNAGLSAGAIVLGMTFGLAIGLFPWAFSNEETQKLVKLLFATSFLIFLVLYPLTWMKRSLFDLTKREEKATVIAGIFYCLAVGAIFWFLDPGKFWYYLSFLFAVYFVSILSGKKLGKKPDEVEK